MRKSIGLSAFFCAVIGVTQILGDDEPAIHRKPIYKYRYQTEDMMKTSATSVPVRGYHVVEGGYYPAESGLLTTAVGPGLGAAGLGLGAGKFIGPVGAGVGPIGYSGLGAGEIGYEGVGPIGLGGIGYGGHLGGPAFIGGGGVGAGIGAAGLGVGAGHYIGPISHGYGGEGIDESKYSGGHKKVADGKYENTHGKKGEEFNNGQEGYSHGNVVVKDIKGEGGAYKSAAGGKNVVQDGKEYQGGENYNQEGKNGGENQIKKGHKKGHKIKGFKTSHHKDESGKTEEYYDEEHDEGNNYAFNGQAGGFGQHGATSYKGGHDNGNFKEEEQQKSGHVENQYALAKQNGDQGKYGQNKYAGAGSVYGVNNGIDQQSLLGHQENARFFKHNSVPFYHHY